MKIYIVEPTCPYSGGAILIAAHSVEEAEKTWNTRTSRREYYGAVTRHLHLAYTGRRKTAHVLADWSYLE